MSRTKDATFTFTIDFGPFVRALKEIGRAFNRMAEIFTPDGRLRRDRNQLGGNGTDAKRWPEMWQSASCSAWLHESCPSKAHRLGCTCACHAKDEP